MPDDYVAREQDAWYGAQPVVTGTLVDSCIRIDALADKYPLV